MISRTNLVLALLLAAVVVSTAIVRVDHSQPNLEFLPDMKYTPAWTAYAQNPNFPNGRSLQAPVPGTIARCEMPLHYAATKEDAVRAGEELLNPYEVTVTGEAVSVEAEKTQQAETRQRRNQSVQRGGEIYRVFCISCHGPTGAGDGPVVKHGFPPPPSMLTGKSLQMKDGQLFHILTYGQSSMPSFAAQLSGGRRWDVINVIRDMQETASKSQGDGTTSSPETGQ